MQINKMGAFIFATAAAIIFTIDRLNCRLVWAIEKAGVTARGYGIYSNDPDYSPCYGNPALWACLLVAVLLIARSYWLEAQERLKLNKE